MHRLPALGLACRALVFVAGSGGDDDANDNPSTVSTPPPASTEPAATTGSTATGATVEVGMKNIKFVPEKITAKVGQKIVWTNNEAIGHNVTATDGADFASDTLQENDTFEYTPKKAGTIKYVCTIHSGQNGEITVTK